jgi:nitroreductase
MERTFNYDIMPEIKQRWSPRAFSGEKIPREEILALLEAARYAPSCFNEQPWRFIIADDEPALSKLRGVLTPTNQLWANNAPVLLLILAKKKFSLDGRANYWHMFDTGTAWGYLTLEAQRRGLITHAMGGFSKDGARAAFNIPDEYDIITVAAVGRYGNIENLSEDLREREQPADRKDIEELLLEF